MITCLFKVWVKGLNWSSDYSKLPKSSEYGGQNGYETRWKAVASSPMWVLPQHYYCFQFLQKKLHLFMKAPDAHKNQIANTGICFTTFHTSTTAQCDHQETMKVLCTSLLPEVFLTLTTHPVSVLQSRCIWNDNYRPRVSYDLPIPIRSAKIHFKVM
jgi:hypothetical protein